ncbi:hypothetical protein ACGF5S_29475 [Nocardia nova]|uniref:hypothetical protein n=1 Tax=Nocardia nova TaxID=37330 RepID=UPI0015E42C71
MSHPNHRNDDDTKEPRGGRPGPVDEGDNGGMATREVADDVGTEENAQEPPD